MVQGIEHRPQKLSSEDGPCILQSSPQLRLVMNLLPGPALGSEKVLRDQGKFALVPLQTRKPYSLPSLGCLLSHQEPKPLEVAPLSDPILTFPTLPPFPSLPSSCVCKCKCRLQKRSVMGCTETQGLLVVFVTPAPAPICSCSPAGDWNQRVARPVALWCIPNKKKQFPPHNCKWELSAPLCISLCSDSQCCSSLCLYPDTECRLGAATSLQDRRGGTADISAACAPPPLPVRLLSSISTRELWAELSQQEQEAAEGKMRGGHHALQRGTQQRAGSDPTHQEAPRAEPSMLHGSWACFM